MIKSTGNELVGYVHYNNETITDTSLKKLGNVDQLETIIQQQHIEEAIISFQKHQLETHIQIVNLLIYNNIITKIPSDIGDLLVGRVKMKSFFDLPFIEIKQIKMLFIESIFKRAMDILISVTALIILFPLFTIIALVIKLTSRGPILYYQERLGIHAEPFKYY